MKPSRLLLGCVALLLALAVLLGTARALDLGIAASASAVLWGLLLGTLAIAVIDAAWLLHKPALRMHRRLPVSLAQGRWASVELVLEHDQPWPLTLTVHDHAPVSMQTRRLPLHAELRPGRPLVLGYELRPLLRGQFQWQRCEVHLPSRLGLWRMRRWLDVADEVRVYPDLRRLPNGRLPAADQALGQLGVSEQPRRGQGLEFHQLREFREGDSLRQIDWKATARQRTPMAREYQDERDQQIVLMLDCGRQMRSQDGELAHFDHALAACLLLSQVALRQGDAVGLMTFASSAPLYIAPRKGPAHLNQMLKSLYDLQPSLQPADFAAASHALLARQPRRALVIWITNLHDEDDARLLVSFKHSARQHRVLVASLREALLDDLRSEPVRTLDSALGYCTAIDYLQAREALHHGLGASGLAVLDVRPDQLGAQLVTRYLGWKKAGML